mgnify:CR=1 FL=1
MILRISLILIVSLTFFTCSRNEKTENNDTQKQEKIESLVEIKNGTFTEYYPGKKQIKFQELMIKPNKIKVIMKINKK